MEIKRWHYYRRIVLPAAWQGFAAEVLPRMAWGILVSVCIMIAGAVLGTLKAGAWAGVLGAVVGLLVAGLLRFLWWLVSAPAKIHAEQASRVEELGSRCAALEGPRILLSDDLEVAALNFVVAKWSGSPHQTSAILRCRRAIPGPFAVSVLTDSVIERGGAYLATQPFYRTEASIAASTDSAGSPSMGRWSCQIRR